MAISDKDKHPAAQDLAPFSETASPGQAQQSALLKPLGDSGEPASADHPIDDLHAAIQEMMELFDVANDLARRGEQVNIDLLAMRVAVLCDAICDADPAIGRPFRGDLEALLGHLDMLEATLRRERVQLALNVEAADRRLRAKQAYGRVLPSMTTPPDTAKRPDDQSNE
ncbi:MAG TPA: hypothetical protein VM639_08460 [Dongiaceae bacterium]|nr:hypothetical protein [Dongiaceae bacterium]